MFSELKAKIKAAYAAANQSEQALITVLETESKGVYQYLGDGVWNNTSLSHTQRANGTGWVAFDNGTSKIPQIPTLAGGVDVEGVLFACYYRQYEQQAQILTNLGFGSYFAGVQFSNTHQNKITAYTQTQIQNPVSVQNSAPQQQTTAQKKVKKNGGTIPETRGWGSDIGLRLLDYFAAKLGFNGSLNAYLLGYGINPVFPTKCEHSYLIECCNAVKEKSVNPEKGRAKARNLQPSETYLFGAHLLPAQPTCSDALIFVEGETDVLCANLHFNQFGYYFVTVGSANGELSQDTANDLKTRFKRIFVLYDNDPVGIAGGVKLANAHGFGWIDPAAFYDVTVKEGQKPPKDFCDLWAFMFADVSKTAPNPTQTTQTIFKKYFEYFCNPPQAQPQAQPTNKPAFAFAQTNIPAIVGDKFSLGVKNAYTFNFHQYLSETDTIEPVLNFLQQNQRVCLQAPAGGGKTTLMLEIAKRSNRPTLLFAPTRGIVEQNAKSFEAKTKDSDLRVLKIDKRTYLSDIENFVNTHDKDALIIGTYDNLTLERFPDKVLQNSNLIFDEFHQFAADLSYRRAAMFRCEDVLQNPEQRVILLSATPNDFFCSGLIDMFNFKLLAGTPAVQNRIRFAPILYKGAAKLIIAELYKRIKAFKESKKKSGVVLIKYDNIEHLQVWSEYLTKRGERVNIFASKGKDEYKTPEKNPNLKSVFEGYKRPVELEEDPFNPDWNADGEQYEFVSGELIEDVDFILTTTKTEAGVNFNFEVVLIVTIDTLAAPRLVQFANRPRYNAQTGLNETVDFWALFPESKLNAKDTPQDAVSLFQHHHPLAQISAEQYNKEAEKQANKQDYIKSVLLQKDVHSSRKNKFIRYSHRKECLQVSAFAILSHIHNKETDTANVALILERIQHTDARIQIQPTQTLTIDAKTANNPADFEELAKGFEAIEAYKEAQIQAFANLCKTDFFAVVAAHYEHSKSPTKRARLRTFLSPNAPTIAPTPNAEFSETNADNLFFEGATNYLERIINEYTEYGYPNKKPYAKTVAKFVDTVFEQSESNARIKATERAHKTVAHKQAQNTNIAADSYEWEHEIKQFIQTLKKRLKNIKEGKYPNTNGYETAGFYADILNGLIPHQNVKFSAAQALETVKANFELSEKRDRKEGKDRVLYQLTARKK